MKKLVLLVFTTLIMAGLSFGQEEITSGDVAKGKSRGGDPNIKVEKRMNSANIETKAVQPAEKGAKARGSDSGYCYVTFDNWTEWYIDCYVDGYYEGYIGPYGSGEITVGSGNTCLYAVAEFDDGSKISWGPACSDCYYDDLELVIYDDYWNLYKD